MEKFDPANDFPLRLLQLYDLRPQRVLEIGAANGYRVAAIAAATGARAVAVEPSTAAIADGRKRFPGVTFVQGIAHAIPVQEQFDLVIVNFVLHWIDRDQLLRSVAEIDRLTADGGFLLLGDFQPNNQLKVRYHHLPDQAVYTYKQNYAATFLASGLYQPICLLTGDHAAKNLTGAVSENDRIGVWLLRKLPNENYVDKSTER